MPRNPKRLVVTFDAFGTLFTPREPVSKSYADIARKHGLSGFTDDQIAVAFRDSFGSEQRHAPNYGKQMGIGAPQWWSNVIHNTFHSFSKSSTLPRELILELLNRFSSSEGYMLYPDVTPLFDELRQLKRISKQNTASAKIIAGIITNSDDRVPSVLSSLGLKVSPHRYGLAPLQIESSKDAQEDIDFVVMSYDVGFGKPSCEIFDAAKQLVHCVWGSEDQEDRFIHVGDELKKDFRGAEQAGWESVLLDREGTHSRRSTLEPQAVARIADLRELRSYISPDVKASPWDSRN